MYLDAFLMYDCLYICVMSFSLVYGFVRDPLAVFIVLSVQALIKKKGRYRCSPETCKWEGLATRAASGRSLRTTSGRGSCQE